MERRGTSRVKRQMRCEVKLGSRAVTGTVLDLSEQGLSIRVPLEGLEQGTAARVVLAPAGGPLVEIEAIVWHARGSGVRAITGRSCVVGFVVSNPPDAFLRLLEQRGGVEATPAKERTLRPPPPPEPSAALPEPPVGRVALEESPNRPPLESAAAPDPSAPVPPGGVCLWRVRVKSTEGPRTRNLQITADDERLAHQRALAETGPGWEVIDVMRSV